MGVEFLFIGGWSLGEQAKQIGNHRNWGSDLPYADTQLDKRSGRYRRKISVPR